MSKNRLEIWYKEGLPFKCTGCGQCCTGAPGYVWLTEDDITRFVNHLEITREEFLRKYTRSVRGRCALKELSENYDCIFYRDTKCTAYQARPKQCRTFPFWDENIKNEAAWNNLAHSCEGVNHKDAPTISAEEIETIRNQ